MLFSQRKGSEIRGYVVENSQTPVMYASVCLISGDKVLAGALTDTTGMFSIKGRFKGEYKLKISSIGYEDVVKSVSFSDEGGTGLGMIVLSQKTKILGDVVVSAKVAEKTVTVEKTRINPSAMVNVVTGSVLDVLKTSPAVSVDADGNISMRGSVNVLFLVDGVPTTLDGLESIPAANVQSIDVVTSPTAKYDAEGTGGIINIVSKRQPKGGLSAMASANYGFNNFMNGNLAMSYNTARWGLRINYSGKHEKDKIGSTLYRQIHQTGSILDQIMDATKRTSGHNVGINIGYKASKHDILTLDVKSGFPRMNNMQAMYNRYCQGGTWSDKVRKTDITFNREMVEGALAYRHIVKPDEREFSAKASISAVNGHRPSYYYEQDVLSGRFQQVQYSKSGGHPRIAAMQVDYMTPFGKGRVETGMKMTYRQNNINHKMFERSTSSDSWQLSYPLSNDLRHREYIPAAYAMFSSNNSKKLSWKAGFRLEYSRVTLNGDKEKIDEAYNCFFIAPNVMASYKAGEEWMISLALSRRISRPTYPQLNPYINLIDNNTYETGNVRLKPEKVNKIDLGYSYGGKRLKVSGNAYFNYSQDYINQVAYIDNNVLVMSYINGKSDVKTGVEHNISYSVLRWMNIDLGNNVFFTKSIGECQGASLDNYGWTANSSVSVNIMPVKGMTCQVQYYFITPQYFPQFTAKCINYCNVGVRKQFKKYHMALSALFTDVFNTRKWDISSDNSVYKLVNVSTNRSRMFWLGISWNFHSFKSLGKKKKQEEGRSIIRFGE